MTEQRRVLVRPAFLRLSVVAFVLLFPAVVYTVWDYAESARMDRVLRRMDPQGVLRVSPGVRLTRDEALADRYYRAAAALAANAMPLMPENQATVNRLANAAKGDAWTGDVLDDLRQEESDNAEALDLATKAAALPFSQFAPGMSYNYQLAGLYNVGRFLGYRAMVRTISGDEKGAVEALFAEARLARTFDNGTTTYLQWRGTDIIQVLSRLHGAVDLEPLARAVGEVDEAYDRAQALALEEIARRTIVAPRYSSIPEAPWLGLLQRPFGTHQLNRRLEVLADMLPAARSPWPDRIDRLIAVGPLGSAPKNLTPREFAEGSTYLTTSAIATFRCARVAIAVERYRRDRGGLPPSADGLTSAYLPAGVVDPFSGHSLRIAANDQGYTVYSVGVNRKDDGGSISEGPTYAFPKEYPADVGVRVRFVVR